jgi:hypothetical protein
MGRFLTIFGVMDCIVPGILRVAIDIGEELTMDIRFVFCIVALSYLIETMDIRWIRGLLRGLRILAVLCIILQEMRGIK